MAELLHLVDEDTEAFNRIMAAFGLPKKTDEDKAARSKAIQEATLYAAQVPLQTMKASMLVFDICRAMAEEGNPNSVSDAGVGALAARAAVLGAALNVKINAGSLTDRAVAEPLIAEADAMVAKAVPRPLREYNIDQKIIVGVMVLRKWKSMKDLHLFLILKEKQMNITEVMDGI